MAAAWQVSDDPVQLEVTRDRLTDRISAFATVRGDRAMLAIGCDPREYRGVRVTLRSRYWLAPENLITNARSFPYRFDRRPARRGRWSTDGRTGWIKSRAVTRNFIWWARSSREVVVRAVDVEGRHIDLVFPLAGAGPAIDRALAICSGRAAPPTA